MRLVRAGEAARMLGVDPDTLRRRAKGGDYVEILGQRLRVYRMDVSPGAEGRYDADEISRILARVARRQ